eukprot:55124_1
MDRYEQAITQKQNSSVSCNGKSLYESGNADVCQQCSNEAEEDYSSILAWFIGKKLNYSDIIKRWKAKSYLYDQTWLSSVKRDTFIEVALSSFGITIIQNAIQLYNRLTEYDKRKYMYAHDSNEPSKERRNEMCSDTMFLWTKKIADIASLDDTHFLYVSALILGNLKPKFEEVEMVNILRCLHKIKLNGCLFKKLDRKVLQHSIIMHSISFKEVGLEVFDQLKRCTERLCEQLDGFDLKSIPPSSICNVPLCDTKDQKEMELGDVHVPFFEQFMATFNSQYNRNAPFDFQVFEPLMTTHEAHKHAMIQMKYDNYSTELNKKTYDHVLKSFIAWSVTLKCRVLRCAERPKLKCFCDTNKFQLYTYNVIMSLIRLKANNDDIILDIISDTTKSTSMVANEFCDVLLPNTLQEKPYQPSYQLHVVTWINFEFYNFVCNYCQHINKTIMIDRVYQYSKTMDSCRICNERQASRLRAQTNALPFDIHQAIKEKKGIRVPNEVYQPSDFTLHSLFAYLRVNGVDPMELRALNETLAAEDYDSDALDDDLNDDGDGDANLYLYLNPDHHDLVRRFFGQHLFPRFKHGKLMRYLVLKPKFFSLLTEICLNGSYAISIADWDSRIIQNVLAEYIKNTSKNDDERIYSTTTDQKFGVEEGEPIGVHHLIAIFVFTDSSDPFEHYRLLFRRTLDSWDTNAYCNDFYWIGRYLNEAVQFYGEKFAHNQKTELYHPDSELKTFDRMAPTFNSPMMILNDETKARAFARRTGCIYTLAPKYYGDVDGSKFLNVDLFNRNVMLLNGAKVQLRSIQIISPQKNFQLHVSAIQYLEKLLMQSQYDAHYINADELYTAKNMKNACVLIVNAINGWKDELTRDEKHPYPRHLFDNWRYKRYFVTFETFKLEMNYMNHKLKQFFFDERDHSINIVNVKKLFPNLKHYHDINGVLRRIEWKYLKAKTHKMEDSIGSVDATKNQSFGVLFNCQEHEVPHHVLNALADIHYDFHECQGVLREAYRMKLSTLDIDHHSFFDNASDFLEHLGAIGIDHEIALQCIEEVKRNHNIHARTDSDDLVKFMLDELDKQSWKRVKCDDLFIQKEAFKKLYSKHLMALRDPIMQRDKMTTNHLYDITKQIQIMDNGKAIPLFDNNTAMRISRYLYIKMMD